MQPASNQNEGLYQPGRILRIKLESCMGYTYELVPKVITISRAKNGEYWSRCSVVDEDLKRIVTKKKLNRKKVESLLAELRKSQIPAVPKFETGCDGSYTEIEIGDYEGKVLYRWWSEPPKGWEELDSLTEQFIEMSGIWD